MTEEKKEKGFSDLIEEEVNNSQDEISQLVLKGLDTFSENINAMQLVITGLDARVAQLEKYVSYLLTKDPQMVEKIKKFNEKNKSE